MWSNLRHMHYVGYLIFIITCQNLPGLCGQSVYMKLTCTVLKPAIPLANLSYFAFSPQTNSFQGLLVTDFVSSYAVFIYKCGLLQWSGDPAASIGFDAGGIAFQNHPLSLSQSARDIACVNSNTTEWSNVYYHLTPNGKMLTLYQPMTHICIMVSP